MVDYTRSLDLTIHQGTGHAMHDDSKPNSTVVSAEDMNSLIWSLNKLREAAGLAAKRFNPDDPETYDWMAGAIEKLVNRLWFTTYATSGGPILTNMWVQITGFGNSNSGSMNEGFINNNGILIDESNEGLYWISTNLLLNTAVASVKSMITINTLDIKLISDTPSIGGLVNLSAGQTVGVRFWINSPSPSVSLNSVMLQGFRVNRS